MVCDSSCSGGSRNAQTLVVRYSRLDLHRFRSGFLRAILAIKGTRYGSDTRPEAGPQASLLRVEPVDLGWYRPHRPHTRSDANRINIITVEQAATRFDARVRRDNWPDDDIQMRLTPTQPRRPRHPAATALVKHVRYPEKAILQPRFCPASLSFTQLQDKHSFKLKKGLENVGKTKVLQHPLWRADCGEKGSQ